MESKKKITIKDVAQDAGVGVGTVSRVLNGSENVSTKVKLKVEQSIAALAYKPDNLARSLRTQKTHTIAFFVNDISNIAFSMIAKGIHQELELQGYHLLIYETGHERVEEKILDAFHVRKFDGIILSIPNESDPKITKLIQESQIPIMLLDREIEGVSTAAVQTDFYNGIRQAVEYLIQLGHRKIGFISTAKEIRPGKESFRGYMDAMKLHDLGVETDWVKRGEFSVEFGWQSLKELVIEQKVTAVIAGNNQLLVGCMEGVRELQLDIPKQLSLIGFEDSDLARLMNPPITVIRRPLLQIGGQIAYLMLKKIQSVKADKTEETAKLVVSTQLVVRKSCAPPST